MSESPRPSELQESLRALSEGLRELLLSGEYILDANDVYHLRASFHKNGLVLEIVETGCGACIHAFTVPIRTFVALAELAQLVH
jgi:hypothetical protein